MSVTDLQQTRFIHSPLMEVAESLWIVSSGKVQPVHRGWYDAVRDRLRKADLELLEAVVPGSKAEVARFLLPADVDGATTVERQLQAVAELPPRRLHGDMSKLWGDELPPRGRELIAAGADGPRRVADALWEYWTLALDPYWVAIRAVVDSDIAHRATTMTREGVATMFAGLHHKVRLQGETLRLDMTSHHDRRLTGAGLRLVPSVFAWPYIVFDVTADHPTCLVYPARGVGDIWGTPGPGPRDDALAALLGRNRAAVLVALSVPYSTVKLALDLGQSPASVSQHLSVLRRAGLVGSQRSGRFVYYERTTLGTSVVEASRAEDHA
jgi:DNA-binding transcriptional ArsR family regulator